MSGGPAEHARPRTVGATIDGERDRLRIGRVLRETARTYRAQARTLVTTAVVVFVPLGLLDALSEHLGNADVENVDGLAEALVVLALGQFAMAALGDQFYAGVAAAAVSESRMGKRRHPVLHLARTLPYATLIAADLLFDAGTTVGLALLVVPGVVFFTLFGLVAPVIKIEGLPLFASFVRSYRLVRGSFWRVLLLLGVVYIGSDLLTSVAQDGSLWVVGESLLGDWAAAAVVGVVVTPIAAVAAVVLTYELIDLDRARRGA